MNDVRIRLTRLARGRRKAPVIICATYWYIYQLSSWFAGWACFWVLFLWLFFSRCIRSSDIWRRRTFSHVRGL